MKYVYAHAILGGTFDHLHAGHEKLILSALKDASRITVGLVQKPLINGKEYPHSIESYAQRENSVEVFFKKNKSSSRTSIIPISDVYGTSLTDPSIEAIFVTQSTQPNALRINVDRAKLGLPPLTIVVIDYVRGDDGIVVSSSRIRAGLIDRLGHSYLKYLQQKPTHHLPSSLRQKLQTPLGTIITNLDELASILPPSTIIISVGDIVSIDLLKARYRPVICVIDHRTRRSDLDQTEIAKYFPLTHHALQNPPGTINASIGELVLTALADYQKQSLTQIIAVDGEEDLLALPTLLLGPLDTYVIYGQYKIGMCVVKVTEEIKSLAKSYLAQFT